MKLKLLQLFTGAFRVPIKLGVSSGVGALIGWMYGMLGNLLHGFPSMEAAASAYWNGLTPEQQMLFAPAAIGTAAAGLVYALIEDLLIKFFKKDVKAEQRSHNDILPPEKQLKVDGIPLDETVAARAEVKEAAAVTIEKEEANERKAAVAAIQRNMRGGKG